MWRWHAGLGVGGGTGRAALVVMLAALVAPAPALARVANFKISLRGTYTAQATMTDARCYQVDQADNVSYFTQTGTASESDSFHSLKPIDLSVGQFPRQRIFNAGSFSRLQTVFTLSRTSSTEPQYCTPSDRTNPAPPDCGSKQGKYSIRVYGRVDRPAFSFLFSRRDSTYYPDDPFQNCPLFGPRWPGQLPTSGPAAIAPGRLFNPRIKKITVHGRYAGTTQGDDDSTQSAHGTYALNWTLTLIRRR